MLPWDLQLNERSGIENVIVSEENKKPPYDEQTLAKLLEAAYVLQEHSDELRALESQLGLTRSQESRSGNMPEFEARPDQNPVPQKPAAASTQKPSPIAGMVNDPLSDQPEFLDATAELSALVAQLSRRDPAEQQDSATSLRCYKCGNELIAGEQFCGQCGAARSGDAEPASMQSKLASLWHMKLSGGTEDDQEEDQLSDPASVAAEVPINVRAFQQPVPNTPNPASESQHNPEIVTHLQPIENVIEVTGESAAAPSPDWTSAQSARDYLQQVAGDMHRTWLAAFWNNHRGDLYLAVAVLVVLIVLRFGLWSNPPVNATRKPSTATSVHKPAARELPLFDRLLIHLGLAEAPPAPEDKGNPSTAVWVDLKTGLYYCPNADPYGKTPKGRYTSQRDAQLDQFAPAYRKVCD